MNEIFDIARTIGFIVQAVGLITIAIKGGQWKGNLESRMAMLEESSSQTIQKLTQMDSRLDNIEKDLLKVMITVQKDIEYIKKSIDEEKRQKIKHAVPQMD